MADTEHPWSWITREETIGAGFQAATKNGPNGKPASGGQTINSDGSVSSSASFGNYLENTTVTRTAQNHLTSE
jgi:hypothetical protein